MDIRALVAKLNADSREALETAAGLCLSRTHYNVEIEHWLVRLIERSAPFETLLRAADIEPGKLSAELNRALDRMKTGNGRAPALSPHLVRLIREAWLVASLEGGEASVSSGHIFTALLSDDDVYRVITESSPSIGRLNRPDVLARISAVMADVSADSEGASPSDFGAGAATSQTGGVLDKFCIDLTARAAKGEIDPVLGRDNETRQIIDILTRRRQNNPILTGEAGVGKTAVVEGFALKIVAGDVPDALKGVRLLSLDLGLLQAGAGVRGEFEGRLKSVIEEIKRSTTPIIVFIDEAHTLIGAGGAEGQGDAANLLKPALARGEMRTIAATTWAEYKKYFEKDPALARRFQVVKVEEPSVEDAVDMMRGLVGVLEAHHKVRVLDEAVDASVRLSHRYISGRQLPDKSISLLDTACARVAMTHAATPAALESARRAVSSLETRLRILGRETSAGADHAKLIPELELELTRARQTEAEVESRLVRERALVSELSGLRKIAEDAVEAGDTDAAAEARRSMTALRQTLTEVRGESPMVFELVDREAIAEVVSAWTGIPVGRMVADEIRNILDIEDIMSRRIRGQPHALSAIAKTVRSARAGLTDPRKPLGVFLMCGASGVGKTETAVTLAEEIYGGAQNMTVINMSEFKEEHKVSMLVGSPPGYVGYGEGGVLTEAVRRKPFSVVLLDEMEKAHPGVQDVFYQVFDKGTLKDGQGRDIDFRNTLIIMTSNAGSDLLEKLCADPETTPEPEQLVEALRPELLKSFKPAFLGRVVVTPYFTLSPEVIGEIIELSLGRLRSRFVANYGAPLTWSPEVGAAISARCTEAQSGARNIESIINQTIVPALSSIMLARMADGQDNVAVNITSNANGDFSYNLAPPPESVPVSTP